MSPYDRIITQLDKARDFLLKQPDGEVELQIATLGDKMVAETFSKVLLSRFPQAKIKYNYPGYIVADERKEQVTKLADVVAQMTFEFGFEGPQGPVGESWWDPADYDKVAEYLYEKGVRLP